MPMIYNHSMIEGPNKNLEISPAMLRHYVSNFLMGSRSGEYHEDYLNKSKKEIEGLQIENTDEMLKMLLEEILANFNKIDLQKDVDLNLLKKIDENLKEIFVRYHILEIHSKR